MKLQFEILFFIVCLNLAIGSMILLDLGGANTIMVSNPYVSATELETHHNASSLADSWQSEPFSGVPILGDLFAGFDFLFRNIRYLLDGFPSLLSWIGESLIVDASARFGFMVLANVLRGLFAILMTWLVIEFISGRGMTR